MRRLASSAWRWIFRIGKILAIALRFLAALVLAPFVLPFAWATKKWPLAAQPAPLPDGIPTRREMKALQPHMAKGDASALRIWLRGAFYFHAIEDYGADPEAAAEAARDLAELANTDGGYRATVKVRA